MSMSHCPGHWTVSFTSIAQSNSTWTRSSVWGNIVRIRSASIHLNIIFPPSFNIQLILYIDWLWNCDATCVYSNDYSCYDGAIAGGTIWIIFSHWFLDVQAQRCGWYHWWHNQRNLDLCNRNNEDATCGDWLLVWTWEAVQRQRDTYYIYMKREKWNRVK